MQDEKIEMASKKSQSSRRSAGTKSSSMSSLLAMKKAKAEGTRVTMEYALKEAQLRLEQADLEEKQLLSAAQATRKKIEIDTKVAILEHERDAAVAQAEVRVIEETLSLEDMNKSTSGLSLESENTQDRTRRYVEQHVMNQNKAVLDPEATPRVTLNPDQFNRSDMHREVTSPTIMSQVVENRTQNVEQELNPNATPFVGPTVSAQRELTQYLLKKELVLTRLTNFDDKPQNYCIWKSSFSGIMHELQVTPIEELDLLVKWLGPESSRYATNIRAANARNPERALQCIWQRLEQRYGCPEMVEAALKNKLASFPKLSNKDTKQLYDLSDLVAEIESTKQDDNYSSLLAYFDTSSGVIPIVNKLPYSLQEKWTSHALKYKKRHAVSFPPFSVFVEFLQEISMAKNDPSFAYESTTNSKNSRDSDTHAGKLKTPKATISTKKTAVNPEQKVEVDFTTHCPVHRTKHTLDQCNGFKKKSLDERKAILKENRICYKCCKSKDHQAKSCTAAIKCAECQSSSHATAMHINFVNRATTVNQDGEEKPAAVASKCTQVCGKGFCGKSCAKTVLVNVYPDGQPAKSKTMYAILDDQSNVSLARSEFFDFMNINNDARPYILSSCAGNSDMYGRRASGFVIEAFDHSARLDLPKLTECDQIPNLRDEIPTPEVARNYAHLGEITKYIPPLNKDAEILLLIGRDLPEAHHVLDQRTGPRNSPYAQRLSLGWVIIGEACLGNVHQPDFVNVNKTHLLPNGRPTCLKPCQNNFRVSESSPEKSSKAEENFGQTVFQRTKDDNLVRMSIEDKSFLEVMDREVFKDNEGHWVAPLPFRTSRSKLPNNKAHALKRAQLLDTSLKKNEGKRQHFVTFMDGIFRNNHAELAPPLGEDEECWYLPIFGVYHPKKPDRIRAVFDSSSQYQGVSLNNVLMTGPDMTNSLLGILLRFRREAIAITADIEQMFYCFKVREDHRNFLRFLWYRDNDPSQELVEYRMCVHVFGNSPSPAVATYGLQKTAQSTKDDCGEDVVELVEKNFYVDDVLVSLPTVEETIDLMQRAQKALVTGGKLRLHKIASNSQDVMEAFPAEDRAKNLIDLNIGQDDLPLQRTLGVTWDLMSDTFKFNVSPEIKPYTRRGVLSTINSLFDPLGLIAPVVIQGKIILRDVMTEETNWDDQLLEGRTTWEEWRKSLEQLQSLSIPRVYSEVSPCSAVKKDILIFADASEKAIAAVAYLRIKDIHDNYQLGFILGKAKVAPTHGHTIPRLELCAAVLAVEIADFIADHLGISPDEVRFYSDSKIVLGYLNNQSRRFHVYVGNRVDRIRKSSKPEQWRYVPSNLNPADVGTRSIAASQMDKSAWLLGPTYLLSDDDDSTDCTYPLDNPDEDVNLRPLVKSKATHVSHAVSLGSHRFEQFSSWPRLVKAISLLKHITRSFTKTNSCHGWHNCQEFKTVDAYQEAEQYIIRVVQQEMYAVETECLTQNKPIPKTSPIIQLNPFIDDAGLLRVGGRLNQLDTDLKLKNPLIIPGRHHIAVLLIRFYHEKVRHQGRHFTEGAIRSAGYWLVGGKRIISSQIYQCVMCRKQRGTVEFQKMSDLPTDRLTPGAPFSSVGVDTFGPWSVLTRRTRGGQANSKRWAILFTCLTTRAIHIEVIEEMTSSSFINALRRFVSIRGKVTEFRSDRGTNFIGSTDDLCIDAVNVEDGMVANFLYEAGTKWFFNPPHSSHMGGVWERLIGVTRRILDGMFTDVTLKKLTHEVLVTLMAEVCAIVNARPIVPVSSDAEAPFVLSPGTLLTQKPDFAMQPIAQCEQRDMYKAQWKQVQVLADIFWRRWRQEYLDTLQPRRKWQQDRRNITKGDVVLLKEKNAKRNEWQMGMIDDAIPGEDGRVRKAVVRVSKDGQSTKYTRPITEMVLLLSATAD